MKIRLLPRPLMVPCRTASQEGASLIEAMLALLVFTIGALGILGLFLGSFSSTAENQNLTSGYEIAQSVIGYLRANSSAVPNMNGVTITPSSTNYPQVASVMSGYGMPPQASVTLTTSSLANNGQCPCSVGVQVQWNDGGQQNYQTQTVVGY
jgi:type IV pilus assembly protein PilV